ncbi:MAG: hypothetical protein JW888_17260 [Pirellulales bacterium]|nr:hypothetical protein [Pirellulales bacterium]
MSRSTKFSGRFFIAVVPGAVVLTVALLSAGHAAAESHWYKGHTHAHSFWSDGDQFPEMVIDWYKSHGYDFHCLTDHNRLMRGEYWRKLKTEKRPVTEELIAACRKRFGDGWLKFRGKGNEREVLLKTFEEIREQLEEPGKFLMVEGEEITGKCGDRQVHINAINLVDLIPPQKGQTVVETIQADLAAVRRQAKATGRTILAHVNHPNWKHYDITASDLAHATDVRFFEVCNNGHDINNLGDETHPSTERLWDIANTIRLGELKKPPIYGLGSDDAHSYHRKGPRQPNPGRAWIMVRAEKLEIEPLLGAIERGDFYASTGVVLKKLRYDPSHGTLSVEVDPKPKTRYTIEFLGTTVDADSSGKDTSKIGRILARHEGTKATYRLRGDELFVRAAIRSDRKLENPPANSIDLETAWTQPVGWEKRIVESE